ncbi:MAG: hypothetical protein ACE5E6_06245, partial [Phycisphaerae bacterium]
MAPHPPDRAAAHADRVAPPVDRVAPQADRVAPQAVRLGARDTTRHTTDAHSRARQDAPRRPRDPAPLQSITDRLADLLDRDDLIDTLHFGWMGRPYAKATLAVMEKTAAVLEHDAELRAAGRRGITDTRRQAMLAWWHDACARVGATEPSTDFRPHRMRVTPAILGPAGFRRHADDPGADINHNGTTPGEHRAAASITPARNTHAADRRNLTPGQRAVAAGNPNLAARQRAVAAGNRNVTPGQRALSAGGRDTVYRPIYAFLDAATVTRRDDVLGDFDRLVSIGMRVYARYADTPTSHANNDPKRLARPDDAAILLARADALGIGVVWVVGRGTGRTPPHANGNPSNPGGAAVRPITLRALLADTAPAPAIHARTAVRPDGTAGSHDNASTTLPVDMSVARLDEAPDAWPDDGAIDAVVDPVGGESWAASLARRALARGMRGGRTYAVIGWTPPLRSDTRPGVATPADLSPVDTAMWVHAADGQSLALMRGWRDVRPPPNPAPANPAPPNRARLNRTAPNRTAP